MGGFEAHFGDHSRFYPATALVVGVGVYGLTGDGLATLATVVVGYGALVVGLLAPDVDSTQSVIRQRADRAVLGGILLAAVAWLLASDVGASVGVVVDLGSVLGAALGGTADWFVLVVLVAFALYWWGATTTHRGLPHEPQWGIAMAALLALAVWFALPGWRPLARVAVGGGLAAHFFVGYYLHLDRDGTVRGDGPSYERDAGR